MGIPEIVLSDSDLAALDEIKAAAEATRQLQKAMNQAAAPDLGDEEIELSMTAE